MASGPLASTVMVWYHFSCVKSHLHGEPVSQISALTPEEAGHAALPGLYCAVLSCTELQKYWAETMLDSFHSVLSLRYDSACWQSFLLVTLSPACCRISTPSSCRSGWRTSSRVPCPQNTSEAVCWDVLGTFFSHRDKPCLHALVLRILGQLHDKIREEANSAEDLSAKQGTAVEAIREQPWFSNTILTFKRFENISTKLL